MVIVKSGGEAWGFIVDLDNNSDFVLHTLTEYIVIARRKYPLEKTYVVCNDEELVKKAKKNAEKKLRSVI